MTITDLSGSILEDVSFIDIDLSGADFTNSQLINVIFSNLDLTNSKFNYSTLEDIDFTGANLTNADFTGASLTDIDFTGAIFSDDTILSDGTKFSDNDTNIELIKQVINSDVVEGFKNIDIDLSFNLILNNNKLNITSPSDEIMEEIIKNTRDISLNDISFNNTNTNTTNSSEQTRKNIFTDLNTSILSLSVEQRTFKTIKKENNRKKYYKELAKKINESVRSYLKTNVNKTETEVQDIKPVKSIRGKPSDFGKDDKFDDIDSKTNTPITIVYFIPPDDPTEDISINLYDPELNNNGNVISSDIEINQNIYYNYENSESNIYDSIKITRISDISYTLYPSTYDTNTGTYTYGTEGIKLNSLDDSVYNFRVVSANKEYKITVGSTNAQISSIDLISDVCFRGDTNIETDQGIYTISDLKTYKHTINGRKIQAITKTKYNTDKMICIKKNAINDNVPSKDIYVSQKHSIYMDKKLVEARDLVKKYRNVKYVKYQGEYLYNIVFDYHGIIKIHNMYFESLHPKNKVSQMYLQKYNKISNKY